MIRYIDGDILKLDVQALVNPVNTVGVMGAGLALRYKRAFQKNFLAYESACKRGSLRTGRVFVFRTGSCVNPQFIVNLPTKKHWRDLSSPEYIDSGLKALTRWMQKDKVESIAIPRIGCGLGGLDWETVVRPMIEHHVSLSVPIETDVVIVSNG